MRKPPGWLVASWSLSVLHTCRLSPTQRVFWAPGSCRGCPEPLGIQLCPGPSPNAQGRQSGRGSSTLTRPRGRPVFPFLLQVAEGLKDSREVGGGVAETVLCGGAIPRDRAELSPPHGDPQSRFLPPPPARHIPHPKGSILQGQRSDSSRTEKAKCCPRGVS